MRAVRASGVGGCDVLIVQSIPDPRPGPGQVLIEISAAGVNFVEIYQRTGRYLRQLPYTPGSEGAGTVVAVGEGVDMSRVGTRVASASIEGSYAELAAADAAFVTEVPDSVDDATAGGGLLQGMTAHCLLHDVYRVKRGDTILVHAGAGGMGLMLTQMAAHMGVQVITTVSAPDKVSHSRAAGAAHVLGYQGIAAQVRALTGGEGVAAVYDGVGRTTFDASLASLRRHGVLALFGAASGPVPPVDPMRLKSAGSVYLIRPTLVDYIATPADFERRACDVLTWIADRDIDVRIGARYALEDASQAQDDLENRRTTGKLVLIP
jgi:NADPH:quinone reductase